MWNLLSKKGQICGNLRDALEEATNASALTPKLREHLAACADCQAFASDLEASRVLLKEVPAGRHDPSPWFAARVMSAIATRESEFRRSLDTWAVLPRLAAKVTWACALVLLLAGTWLYQHPQKATSNQGNTETLFENAPSTAQQDDVLASALEPNHD